MDTTQDYKKCKELETELTSCHDLLYTVYYNAKKDEVINKQL